MTCVVSTPWRSFDTGGTWTSMLANDSPSSAMMTTMSRQQHPQQAYHQHQQRAQMPQGHVYVSPESDGRSTPMSNAGSATTSTHALSTTKKRPSRAGTRSVSTLSPAQLARKRANDREAQRAIRQRTKEHIETLEKAKSELTAQRDASERLAEIAQHRNRELEEEVHYLRTKMSEAGLHHLAMSHPDVHRPTEAGMLSLQSGSAPVSATHYQRQSSNVGGRNITLASTHSPVPRWHQFNGSTASGLSSSAPMSAALSGDQSLTTWRSNESMQPVPSLHDSTTNSSTPYGPGTPSDRSGSWSQTATYPQYNHPSLHHHQQHQHQHQQQAQQQQHQHQQNTSNPVTTGHFEQPHQSLGQTNYAASQSSYSNAGSSVGTPQPVGMYSSGSASQPEFQSFHVSSPQTGFRGNQQQFQQQQQHYGASAASGYMDHRHQVQQQDQTHNPHSSRQTLPPPPQTLPSQSTTPATQSASGQSFAMPVKASKKPAGLGVNVDADPYVHHHTNPNVAYGYNVADTDDPSSVVDNILLEKVDSGVQPGPTSGGSSVSDVKTNVHDPGVESNDTGRGHGGTGGTGRTVGLDVGVGVGVGVGMGVNVGGMVMSGMPGATGHCVGIGVGGQ